MQFRVEARGGDAALSARTLDAADRAAALEALEPAERLGLRSLTTADEPGSPAQALAGLAGILERGAPLSPELRLAPAAQRALAQGQPLDAVLAAEPSAPRALVEALAAVEGEQAAALVRLGAGWLNRIESARREQATRLIYPLCLLALACALLGVVLGLPYGFEREATLPGARLPGVLAGVCVLLGGGAWLRSRWGKPGPRAALTRGFRLQALAVLVRAEVDLTRAWPGLWPGSAPPSDGDPCAAVAAAAGLGAGQLACLRHAVSVGPAALAAELDGLGEAFLCRGERNRAWQARLLAGLGYASAAAVALGVGASRLFLVAEVL